MSIKTVLKVCQTLSELTYNHAGLTTLTAQDDYTGYSLEEHRTRIRNVWKSEGKCMDMSKDLLDRDCLLEIQGHS